MILCEWDAPEGNPDNVAYACMLSYPIIVSHMRFNFLCLLCDLETVQSSIEYTGNTAPPQRSWVTDCLAKLAAVTAKDSTYRL
jgi:hypothetical protein